MRTAVRHLGRGYVAAGAERILVLPGKHDHFRETEEGIEVYVKAPEIVAGYRMIFETGRALSVLDRFRPTSVEVSDKWTLTAVGRWARRRGIGSVLFSHERLDAMASMWLRERFRVNRAVQLLYRRLVKEFDSIVVTSDYAADEYHNLGANLVHVPLGVDLTTFHPDKGSPVDDGILKLAYVGRLSREKSPHLGVATAVELHRQGVPVRLDMYGVGPDEQELRELASDAPVVFHGYVDSREEIARRLAGADFALSVCPAETFGLAVLEALACGTPVITADRGGGFELVTRESGAWAAPDPESLADALLRAAARPRQQMRVAARAQAERYPWQNSIDRMLTLHHHLAREVPYLPMSADRLRRALSPEAFEALQFRPEK
ncbi:glycosyltransferase [Enemella sp. A6]|uniref:glycosyltransferase n=1 Tax=Enemella sp. A6 TaxID=3440152 RepID=UPI003EB695C4